MEILNTIKQNIRDYLSGTKHEKILRAESDTEIQKVSIMEEDDGNVIIIRIKRRMKNGNPT